MYNKSDHKCKLCLQFPTIPGQEKGNNHTDPGFLCANQLRKVFDVHLLLLMSLALILRLRKLEMENNYAHLSLHSGNHLFGGLDIRDGWVGKSSISGLYIQKLIISPYFIYIMLITLWIYRYRGNWFDIGLYRPDSALSASSTSGRLAREDLRECGRRVSETTHPLTYASH